MYRLLTPVNLEYSPASNYHAVNYKYVNDKIAEVQETITTDLSGLDEIYAAINHTHTGYALADHNHDTSYSPLNHDHDSAYASLNHDHSGTYSPIDHNHNSEYAGLSHNHDTAYSAIGHTHDPFTLSTISSITGTNIVLSTEGNMFKKAITANTTFTFDVSGITFDQTKEEVLTFELLVVMGATVYTIAFPNTLTWLDTNPPTFATPSKSYLLAFRSYDNGQSWIGTSQGMF